MPLGGCVSCSLSGGRGRTGDPSPHSSPSASLGLCFRYTCEVRMWTRTGAGVRARLHVTCAVGPVLELLSCFCEF